MDTAGGEDGAAQEELLPGLPAELALRCLGRVPCDYDHVLRAVCTTWHSLVDSPRLHEYVDIWV